MRNEFWNNKKSISYPRSEFVGVLYYKHTITLITLFPNRLTFYSRNWLKSTTPFCTDLKLEHRIFLYMLLRNKQYRHTSSFGHCMCMYSLESVKSLQSGVVDFNYFLLSKVKQVISKIIKVISRVIYCLIFSIPYTTFRRH